MDVSIIIVNWNTKDYLDQCLRSLTLASPSPSVEVIVVDNGSMDGSPEMVKDNFPNVKLIRSLENLGFAKGNNLGIQHSSGRYISLVNSDIEILPGCLDALADYLDNNPTVGIVGPRILNSDMTLQSSCRRFPTVWNNFRSAIGLPRMFPKIRRFSGEHMLFSSHEATAAVDVLVGCFWMIRRTAIETVGSLDEDFFMYGEDVDWCRRCWDAGWKVIFLPHARAIHHRGASSAALPIGASVLQQRSILHYWSKHHGPLRVLAIKCVFLCHHLIRSVVGLALRFFGSSRSARSSLRFEISKACLRALLSDKGPLGAAQRTGDPDCEYVGPSL
jgi:GT2 family glycosyltransferase